VVKAEIPLCWVAGKCVIPWRVSPRNGVATYTCRVLLYTLLTSCNCIIGYDHLLRLPVDRQQRGLMVARISVDKFSFCFKNRSRQTRNVRISARTSQ